VLIRMRDFRIIPIVLVATGSLLALKVAGLVLDGGYTLVEADATAPQSAADTDTMTAPATTPNASPVRASFVPDSQDITGSSDKVAENNADGAPPPPPAAAPKPVDPPPSPGGRVVPLNTDQPASPGERAILEHLQTRRQDLDTRAREMEVRDNLIKEAEKRLDSRASELKDIEQRINAATQKKEEAEAGRLKNLVVMYENMKPKDAAKVFDRLNMKVLIELASAMNPRRMSDIMAQMLPDNAERLTVELANQGASDTPKAAPNQDLPKIEGRPTAPDGSADATQGGANAGSEARTDVNQ
jgi:flagellar motility protein MotE (MotC chaperone)